MPSSRETESIAANIAIRETLSSGDRVKSGRFGHQVNSDTHLQTV